MKLHAKGVTAICLLGAMGACVFAACDKENPPADVADDVTVTAVTQNIAVKDYEVAAYDFTSLFAISSNGEDVAVTSSHVDSSAVLEEAGAYSVVCNYGGESASVQVVVSQSDCSIVLSKQEITVRQALWESYPYLELFTATLDGEPLQITKDMVTSNVARDVGDYSVTVSFFKTSATLTVHITDAHEIEAIPSWNSFEIEESALAEFDFTSLFSLYVDGVAVRVTGEMLDISALEHAEAGQTYSVTLRHTVAPTTVEKAVSVKVVADRAVTVRSKNLETYPNSDYIDLTSLFEIEKGGEVIPVTSDMVTGTIDYSKAGENVITLSYGGETYTATVTVREGAVIDYASSDYVNITLGTKKETYAFADDFIVTINGLRFRDIPDSCFVGLDTLDFNRADEYQVTLRIPYNDQKLGWGTVNFDYIEKTITYNVTPNNYTLTLGGELVTLPEGTTEYDPLGNITLLINGGRITLTSRADFVNNVTNRYALVLSEPLDFNKAAEQEVRVAIYIDGMEEEPVEVAFSVIVDSGVRITARDIAVFSGATLYTKDLFTVTEDGEEVEVTYDMLSGKADTFTPGVYTVTIEYRGIKKQAHVTVFDKRMTGTYTTTLRTIDYGSEEDEDYGEDYGDWGEDTGYAASADAAARSATTRLGDLVISEDGSITLQGKPMELIGGLNENVMLVRLGSNDYTLYYWNGIVVLDPDNSIKLAFSDYKRPLIYFNTDMWTIERSVTVNYGAQHVLATNFTNYSIDTFHLVSKEDGSELWYGLKIRLAEKTSADTVYVVSWGEVKYAEDFVPEAGAASSLVFDGDTYKFVMQDPSTGKVDRSGGAKKFANKTFNGTIGGESARIQTDANEGFTISFTGGGRLNVPAYKIDSMKNGGPDYAANTVLLYAFNDSDYATPFSYKFSLDAERKTFELIERDAYFGLYQTDGMYVFLDGYGTGAMCFDTKSYAYTQIAYTVQNNEICVRFVNTSPTFAYGREATFYVSPLLNVLTVKQFEKGAFAGKTFENAHITDGAIVKISSYLMAANGTNGKNNLLSMITINTKDGAVTEKASYVNCTKVDFNTAGFYLFTVKVTVGGKAVETKYTIQIVNAGYQDSPFLGTFKGVASENNSVTIDKSGIAKVVCGSVEYDGLATLTEDGFVIKARSGNAAVTAVGSVAADGILTVQCSGAAAFLDRFIPLSGSTRIAGGPISPSGTLSIYLRVVTVNGANTFFVADSQTSMGEIATAELLEGTLDAAGCVVKVTYSGGVKYFRVNAWNNLETGLTVLENYGA